MKLVLEYLEVCSMEFSDQTYYKDKTLYVSKQDLQAFIDEEPIFSGVNISIAKPGEKARIVNVVDCIEPRCKVEEEYSDWPGFLMERFLTVGEGTTRALKGITVMVCDNNTTWSFPGYMDMFEPGSRLTPYGEMYNLVIEPTFVEKKNLADFAQALHRVKFKISAFLARQTLAVKADFSELFDNETVYPGLPRIAYAYQVYSKQYNTNNYDEPMFYGYSIADTLPLVVQPTEIIDGALSSVGGARLMETYSIQNHCVILDLLRRHGKDINFVGTVITVVSLDGKRRHLASTMLGNLMKEVFHADGVILTKNLGGAGNVCMAEAASKCEDRGIKTTMILQILNAESNLSSEILFDDKRLNAIVQNGVYFDRVCLPAVDVVYGGPKDTKIFSDRFEQKATDALELQAYCVFGRICQTGSNYEHAEEY